MTLLEYIKDQPGGSAHADMMYNVIDREALKLGATLKRLYPHVEELRLRGGTPNTKARCQQMADAMERDPTGRLMAMPELYAWAEQDDGVGPHWVNWYKKHLEAWLVECPQMRLEAAE